MAKLRLYIAALHLLLTSIAANDLFFVTGPGCNLASGHSHCYSPQPGSCCTAGAPFCGHLFCNDCHTGNDLYTFPSQSCRGKAYRSCREQGHGSRCCVELGGGKGCAAEWHIGGARKRSMDMTAPEACTVVHHPNHMVYFDENGVRREIYMPVRDFFKACAHYKNEEWDELAKFPKWENQSYTEDDDTEDADNENDASKENDAAKENDASEKK
ncbi:hypothetical protein A9K55_000494 [Cordyceps militaris]|uniref:Uncharacterized protein n=1 Tax=Cordyceps militaris TaxID=73501 RepID=A0A2H4STV5_CORMI|nr:hypothetical protein A9K55_000494 [Cordyceps militaris]